MSKADKPLAKILNGESDANIRFDDVKQMLLRMGFRLRVRGSHHHFSKDGFEPSLQLQPIGGMCKVYQVRQLREALNRN